MSFPLPQERRKYNYSDYLEWDGGERWELINGEAYAMSPAPSTRHQIISVDLTRQLSVFLKGKRCRLFTAPFDVRLNAGGEDDTVVQPDLAVVCDPSKIDEKGCKGAPDLVIEILSPSTARHDRIIKLEIYRHAGISEYWIADPDTKTVQVCMLRDGLYFVRGYTDSDTVPVGVLPGCEIILPEVFAE